MKKISFEEELDRNGFIVYRCKGTSMRPLIRQDRDLTVICKRDGKTLEKYDAVLYKKDGAYILHRILKARNGSYVICGDNTRQKEYDVADDMIIGVLSEVVRDGKKTVKVTDAGYRLYVHLWCDLFLIRASVLFVKEKASKIKRRLIKKA